MQIRSVGIDLGKTTFHRAASSDNGKVLLKKKFTQKQLITFTANLQTSSDRDGGMFWSTLPGAVRLRAQGHDVKLLPAQFVKPFVKSNKNDFIRHSVRGIVVHRKHLYVAYEAGDAVKVFNVQSGQLMAHIAGRELEAPVHLIMHGETLYIGASGTGSILALELTSTPASGKLKARVVIDGKLDSPSGFAIGP